MLHHHSLRMREVPVRMDARGGGASSITSGKSAYYMVKVLLALFIGLFRARPVPAPSDPARRRRRGATPDDAAADRRHGGAVCLLLIVLELVRRRRLLERYALLWLAVGLALVVLGAWRGLLTRLSDAIGVAAPPNALFAVGLGVPRHPGPQLLRRHLPSQRPDEGAGAAARACWRSVCAPARRPCSEVTGAARESVTSDTEAPGSARRRRPPPARIRPPSA